MSIFENENIQTYLNFVFSHLFIYITFSGSAFKRICKNKQCFAQKKTRKDCRYDECNRVLTHR